VEVQSGLLLLLLLLLLFGGSLFEFALDALVLDPVPDALVLVFPAVRAKYLIEK
jgi:hypothetical protein